MNDNAKKNYILIISVILIMFVCVSVFFYKDYSHQRNGKTFESRELILQENYDADYLICEEKVDGVIFSGYELANGRTGLARFVEDNDRYRVSQSKYANQDVPAVLMDVLNGKYCYLIFFNQPNMKRVEVTYEVTTFSGTREKVTFDYDITDYAVICSESPQAGQPISIIYYDTNGNEYRFVGHPETREMYVKEN